eukprot:Opistho-2@5065
MTIITSTCTLEACGHAFLKSAEVHCVSSTIGVLRKYISTNTANNPNFATMAHRQSLSLFAFVFAIAVGLVAGADLSLEIYSYPSLEAYCFLTLNNYGSIGCTTVQRGASGIVLPVSNDADLFFLLNEANGDAHDFVALVDPTYLNSSILTTLESTDNVHGILIGTGNRPSAFSPAASCPNCNTQLYKGDTTPVAWNPYANNLGNVILHSPIFLIGSEQTASLKQLAMQNRAANSFPAWAVQMSAFMNGARDSTTCLRRGFCDTIGGHSPWAMAKISTPGEQYILASAELDALGFFRSLSYGGNADVTGFVTLMAAAQAIGQIVKQNVTLEKNIMFALFDGESFNNLGSANTAWAMLQGTFPSNYPDSIPLSAVASIVHVSQIGLRGDPSNPTPLYYHTDRTEYVPAGVSSIVTALQASAADAGVTLSSVAGNQGLPPASAQSFLQLNRTIPAVVVADHAQAYTNK